MTPARQPQRELLWEPHWITPPELYQKLDTEFHFDFDPCPFPKPEGYNGLNVEWGKSNYVNPPFHRENGIGPTAFARKAVAEYQKGKTVILTLPVPSYVNFLLEAGAEMRSLGRVRWLHTVTREPTKQPSPIAAFILRATHTSPPPPALFQIEPNSHDYTIGQIVEINENIQKQREEAAKAAREEFDKLLNSRIAKMEIINSKNPTQFREGALMAYRDIEESIQAQQEQP